MSDKRKLRELKRELRRREKAMELKNALMLQAASTLDTSSRNIEALQARNDVWRNLMVACAFARGLGNERPISEVIEECHPHLMRGAA